MGRIIVNRERCKACYLCLDVCPKKCIEKDTSLNMKGCYPITFNEEKGCIGCAVCAKTCPDLAIEKVYR
ncbi:MAG: 4Fe-4S binding protein [Candidatus Gastranaerophilales bacterium]|nr:4Fe-4S binding protein [Candidatus Gastranaerophilales bacterium]